MLFNSTGFAIFFPVVTLLYFACPHRFRWALLLAASCGFYMAFVPAYVLILLFTIGIDYVAGIQMERSSGCRRKVFLIASLCANIGVLAAFKYYAFVFKNAQALLGAANPLPWWDALLPIGLSFHTFQAMSYTIEVYRCRQPAERHPGIFALYVMFYPQLVAGPIERPQHLLPQFRRAHHFHYQRAVDGLRLMAWGFFKKLVVADRLALMVNPVYDSPRDHSGLQLTAATLCFGFQIYADFAGYTDIARGAAQVMGFNLVENFKQPYFATSIVEFWRRWHISLSTWFRDYLYIPLGGSRVATPRWCLNIAIVFLVSGLWHGANWTFAAWGAVHGCYVLLYHAFSKRGPRPGLERHPRLTRCAGRALTFFAVSFAWIFFRANTLADAAYIATHLFQGWRPAPAPFEVPIAEVVVAALALTAMFAVEQVQQHRDPCREIAASPAWLRWTLNYALCGTILFFGQFGRTPFIYFQF